MTHEQKAREALSAGEAYADSVDAETGSVVSVNDFANGYLSGHAAAKKECEAEIAALRQKLAEAETTIHRMCHGDADADRNYAS